MNSSFFQLFSAEICQSIAIYTFLLIIVICFLRFFVFKQETESRGVQKIIGGLAVFVVALLSQNFWIQALSLFIGGLIIASEDFMQKLAIIVRSESRDIGKNLEITKPSKEEIKEKREAEVKEIQKSFERKTKKTIPKAAVLRTVVLAESLVNDYLEKKLGGKLQEQAKIEGTSIIADVVIFDEAHKSSSIVEIKQMPSLDNAFEIIKLQANQIFNQVSISKIIFCIVLDNKPLQSEIKKFIVQAKNLDRVEIGIFYTKSDRLIPIVEPKL
mgnify:CR=1 FL=1